MLREYPGTKGFIVNAAMAATGPDVQVVVLNNQGQAFHTVRQANGNWQSGGFQPLSGVLKDIGRIQSLTAAATGDGLQIGAVSSDGKLYHAKRTSNGDVGVAGTRSVIYRILACSSFLRGTVN